MRTPPLYDFTADDGVSHTLWRVAEPAGLVDAFARVPLLYVADGHHRAASASRARAHFKAANPRHTGDEEYNRVLATLFPAGQLRILPYNRVVADLRRTVAARLPGRARRPLPALARRPIRSPRGGETSGSAWRRTARRAGTASASSRGRGRASSPPST